MGLEVLDKFRPITAVQTVSIARNFNHRSSELVHEPEKRKELVHDLVHDHNEDNENEGGEECHTPRSPSHTLKSPWLCPPAPKKPRVTKRNSAPPAQGYFQVPHDLASVFVLHTMPSKKIMASSCIERQVADS